MLIRKRLGILALLLNDGTSPHTGAQILRPETVKGRKLVIITGFQKSLITRLMLLQRCLRIKFHTCRGIATSIYQQRSRYSPKLSRWFLLPMT